MAKNAVSDWDTTAGNNSDVGARVIIADENPQFGGIADSAGGTIDGEPQADWMSARGAELAVTSGNPNVIADVELIKGTIAAAFTSTSSLPCFSMTAVCRASTESGSPTSQATSRCRPIRYFGSLLSRSRSPPRR